MQLPRSAYSAISIAALLVLALVLGLSRSGAAQAAAYTVDSSADAADDNPGDGVCRSAAGQCTLRAAVMEANAHPGRDTIALPAGTYTLTIAGSGEDAAASGDLDITDHLTITGAGAFNTIIEAAPGDRALHVLGPVDTTVPRVTIENVTIRGGNVTDAPGGAIHNSANLRLIDSIVSGNAAALDGGGIFSLGTLTLTSVTLSGNTAGAEGGGIYNGGTLSFTNGVVSNGSAGANGGAIFNRGTLALNNIAIDHNSAGLEGGGVSNSGTVTLTNSTVTKNTARLAGGGVVNGGGTFVSGTMAITNTTVSGNNAGLAGGGIANRSTLTIANATVSANSGALAGGGIVNLRLLSLTNTTVSDNSADAGGGFFNSGNQFADAVLTLTNATVSGNRALGVTVGDGGGIYNATFGTLTAAYTTISNNAAQARGGAIFNLGTTTASNTVVANSGDNCAADRGIVSVGHNLDSGDTCGFTAAGDLVNTDPKLGPLADNGGPTQTHALLPSSPAIDRGDSAGCPASDQRGVPRPQGAGCDVGAYEFQAPTPTPAPTPAGLTNLVAGLNLVLYSGAPQPVEQALGNCLTSVDAVFFWNAAAQTHNWWFKGATVAVNTLAALSPGQVLWMRASAACSWRQS